MEFALLKKEYGAVKYVYDNAIPKKIPYSIFEKCIQDSDDDGLPEFYVIKNEGQYIGYLFLLADRKENIPKPFTFLACHNGDQLSTEQHKKLLEFVRTRAREKGWEKLLWLAENELRQISG